MVLESTGISRRWSSTQINRCRVIHYYSVRSLFNLPSPKKQAWRLNATLIENPLTALPTGPKTSVNNAVLKYSFNDNIHYIINHTLPFINASFINNSDLPSPSSIICISQNYLNVSFVIYSSKTDYLYFYSNTFFPDYQIL